ncbi:DUF1707 domain-containing protein [Tsukamurella strandjordii]|uniref:DUF1707 SHOCT-like domain-containing protein n=1 Tax=Tsukamurella TaxID=2060 RepID=UPI001C7D71DE|nr:DUF1707 domain-containing protein [Tsukamurella sp. TY48]GIZ99291.1 hypothetical protein TTY48_39030 [Tsukamurella sp. TY48]
MSENFDSNEREFGGAGKRARDADREEVMGLLDSALSDGQLDGAEHRDRVATALRASTLGELTGLVDDLQVAAPSFLAPPTDRPATPARVTPSAPVPAPAKPPSTKVTRAESSVDSTTSTALIFVVVIVLTAVLIGGVAKAMNDSSGGTFGDGGPQWSRICDSEGKNCRDQNGRAVPDDPPAKKPPEPVAGVRLVGNPMASTNIRAVYESMTTALKPVAVVSLTIDQWGPVATLALPDDPENLETWVLRDGMWRYSFDLRNQTGARFAPDVMNLDAITTAIADAPGITRTVREPTRVAFAATAVTIDYTGPAGTSSTLILAPDGTVVP